MALINVVNVTKIFLVQPKFAHTVGIKMIIQHAQNAELL